MDEQPTLPGLALDIGAYATVLNPFFTSRIGTSGWDPRRNPILSRLNRFLAPGAQEIRGDLREAGRLGNRVKRALKRAPGFDDFARNEHKLTRSERLLGRLKPLQAVANEMAPQGRGYTLTQRASEARRRLRGGSSLIDRVEADVLKQRTIMDRGLKATDRVFRTQEAAARAASRAGTTVDKAVDIALKDRKRGFFSRVTSLVGEPGTSASDKFLRDKAFKEMGNFQWMGKLWGHGWKETHRAIAYGVGRGLTGLSSGLLVYDAIKLALAPVEMVANIGLQARNQPQSTLGSGMRDSGLAPTLRQRALLDMQTSSFGPRSMIGNEAPFLHV